MRFAGGQLAYEELCGKSGRRWDAIDNGLTRTDALVQDLANTVTQRKLLPSDTALVVFGSIARGEYSVGSDVDWTLLVDGQADPAHFVAAQEIAAELKAKKLQEPGPTATFGNVTFSHELVHHIGGQSDTNRNTTQRILLLLESLPIGDPAVYDRVIRVLLARYLDDDISFTTRSRSGQKYKVPRFLLNDIVRYWRTICVDYATKHRERRAEGWALRNAKLRMSRKLIFASGLLMCFSCYLQPPTTFVNLFDQVDDFAPLVDHLERYVRRTPIDITCEGFLRFSSPAIAARFMDAYADFSALLNDGTKRDALKALPESRSQSDPVFNAIRDQGDRLQEALSELFFDANPVLTKLTRKYGLF